MNESILNNDTVFRYPVDVRFFEVDSLGVVFNMWYLGWCDEAMSAFMESIGYDIDRIDIHRTDMDRVEASDHGRTRCARVAITYVCVAVDGRRKVPIPQDLRVALVRHHA
ncbi:MAG TPA: hypothetical protein VIL87_09465 [Dermatophilaceae bacterium]|jgi:acyl-CoA thioester hydrolase